MYKRTTLIFMSFLIIFLSGCIVLHSESKDSNYFNKNPIKVNGLVFTVMNETIRETNILFSKKYEEVQFTIKIENPTNSNLTCYLGLSKAKDYEGKTYGLSASDYSLNKKAFATTIIEPGKVIFENSKITVPLDTIFRANELVIEEIRVER